MDREMDIVKASDIDSVAYMVREAEGCVLDGEFIVLNYGGYPYAIHVSRITSPGKILGWIRQLSEKNWMNAHRLNLFATLAFQQIGIEVDNAF